MGATLRGCCRLAVKDMSVASMIFADLLLGVVVVWDDATRVNGDVRIKT